MTSRPTKQLTLVFLRRNDEVLLAMKKRGFGVGKWNGVGGKLELGETVEQALVREAEEEIGVTLTRYEKVAKIIFDEHVNGEPTFMHVHVYLAGEWQGEPSESEEMYPQWFKQGDIPYDVMWSDDEYWLPVVLDGKKLQAEFTLDASDVIVAHDIKIVDQLT